MALEYKSMDLELPPLGELICICTEDGVEFIGYSYINSSKERRYSCATSSWGLAEPKKWAPLPTLIPISEKLPPIGENVLLLAISPKTKILSLVCIDCFLKGQTEMHLSYTANERVKAEYWLPMEVFNVEK